jgi:hypothetical protein
MCSCDIWAVKVCEPASLATVQCCGNLRPFCKVTVWVEGVLFKPSGVDPGPCFTPVAPKRTATPGEAYATKLWRAI